MNKYIIEETSDMAFRLPRLQLHTKIFLALVLGILFGVIFNVSKYELSITSTDENHQSVTEVVDHWTAVEFIDARGMVISRFGPEDRLAILSSFGALRNDQKKGMVIWVRQESTDPNGARVRSDRKFEKVSSIRKVETIATAIKPIGMSFFSLVTWWDSMTPRTQ